MKSIKSAQLIFVIILAVLFGYQFFFLNNNLYPIFLLTFMLTASFVKTKIKKLSINLFAFLTLYDTFFDKIDNVNYYSLIIGVFLINNIESLMPRTKTFVLLICILIITYFKSIAILLSLTLIYLKVPLKYILIIIASIYFSIFIGIFDSSRKVIYLNVIEINKEKLIFGYNNPFIEEYNDYLGKNFYPNVESDFNNIFNSDKVGFLNNPVNDYLYIVYDGGIVFLFLFIIIIFWTYRNRDYNDFRLTQYFLLIGFFNFSFYNLDILTSIFCISLIKSDYNL